MLCGLPRKKGHPSGGLTAASLLRRESCAGESWLARDALPLVGTSSAAGRAGLASEAASEANCGGDAGWLLDRMPLAPPSEF